MGKSVERSHYLLQITIFYFNSFKYTRIGCATAVLYLINYKKINKTI